MKKTFLILALLFTSLPVLAGDFFGDLFNPDDNKYVYSIGGQAVQYAIDENGQKYVYSIGGQAVQYAIDKNGQKYVYSIGGQAVQYAIDKNVTNK